MFFKLGAPDDLKVDLLGEMLKLDFLPISSLGLPMPSTLPKLKEPAALLQGNTSLLPI